MNTGKWSTLENFVLEGILGAFSVSDPETIMTLFNYAILHASDQLKQWTIEDSLCARN